MTGVGHRVRRQVWICRTFARSITPGALRPDPRTRTSSALPPSHLPESSPREIPMPTGDTGGYLPRWTVKHEGIIAPDERLPWGQTAVLGVQHVFAMFGATVLVPILMGFDPNTAIFFSGIGTLLFFLVVGGRVPSYLGSSFAFVAVVITATGYQGTGPNANIGVALGGII